MDKSYNDTDKFLQDIKEESVRELVLNLGYLTEDDFTGSKVSCVFHEDDRTPSLQITDNFFKCYSCDAKGDFVKWVQLYDNLNFIEALRSIADKMNISLEISRFSEYNKMRVNLDREWSMYLKNMSEQLSESSGLSDYLKEMSKEYFPFKIGYDKRTNYIVLPFTSKTGNILGFTKRRVDYQEERKIAKWIHSSIKDSLISHCSNLFNLDKAHMHISKSESVYIVEGPKDVAAMIRAGYQNTIAICGASNINDKILSIISRARKIILCLDGDKPGISATIDNIITIASHNPILARNTMVCAIPDGEDPASLDIDELKRIVDNPIRYINYFIDNATEEDISNMINKSNSSIITDDMVIVLNNKMGYTRSHSIEWININRKKSESKTTSNSSTETRLLATIGKIDDINVKPMMISEDEARKILKLRYGYKDI